VNRVAVIEEVDVDLLHLSLRTTFQTHWKKLRRHATVRVRISSGGIHGEGEAYTLDPEGARASLGDVDLLGIDPWGIETITGSIPDPAARSAVDLALHDLLGKACSLPVHRLLGLPRARRSTCISIGIDEPERMVASARERIAQGFPILKIKLTTETDLSVIEEIRRLGGPGLRIWVDANQAYEPQEAIAAAEALALLDVEIFEQPLAVGRIRDYAAIRGRIALPIVLDEEIHSAKDVAAAAEAGGIDGINVKLAKLGGIRESLRAIHVARAHGLGVFLGCYFESSLGIAASSHLLALADRVDLDAPLFLERDPYTGLEFEGAEIGPPDRPGIGVVRR
jgi:L-alanine-DL-glutamate epimerase-like enolase superfamily enzyme